MCLVEVSGPRGATLQPACFVPVSDGMEVVTTSAKVKKAQDGVLEFLLVNHPLDCPVCDKGGECPLQDQTLAYGPGESRFLEEKRHFAKPIPISELVLFDRERCIQCGRCTRFAAEIAGEAQIDFAGRGEPSRSTSSRRPPSPRTSAATPCRSAPSARSPPPRTGSRPGPGTSTRSSRRARRAPSAAGWRSSPRRTGSPACSASTASRSTRAGCATRAASGSRRSTATGRWGPPRARAVTPRPFPSRSGGASRARSTRPATCARAGSPSRWSARTASSSRSSWTEALAAAADRLARRPGRARGRRRGLPRRRPALQRGRLRLGQAGQGGDRHRLGRRPARRRPARRAGAGPAPGHHRRGVRGRGRRAAGGRPPRGAARPLPPPAGVRRRRGDPVDRAEPPGRRP